MRSPSWRAEWMAIAAWTTHSASSSWYFLFEMRLVGTASTSAVPPTSVPTAVSS